MYTLLTMKAANRNKTYKMTPELEKRLEKVEEDIKHNRNLSPRFKTAKEMNKYLDSLK